MSSIINSLISISLPIAGVTFEKRQALLELAANGDPLRLVAEPTNKYDRHAVQVVLGHHVLGYVPSKSPLKDEIFSKLHYEEGEFLGYLDHKRGGGKLNWGADVTFSFYPNKEEEEDIASTRKSSARKVNRHDADRKFKWKDFAVQYQHGYDSKAGRKEFSRKLRRELNNSLEPVGKTANAKYFRNWKKPYITAEEHKAIKA